MEVTRRKDSRGRVLHTGEYELKKTRKDGGQSIYYSYQYLTPSGKRASISATSLESLRQKELELAKDLQEGLRTGRDKRITVGEMVDIYLETKLNLKVTSAANYQYMAEKFIKPSRVGQMRLCEVKKSDIQRWYGELLKGGFKANSLEVIHTIVHPAFQRAIDDGYIKMNPTQGVIGDIKRSKYWNKPRKHALTKEEQESFVWFVKGHPVYAHWMPLFTVLLGTGARVGEIVGLTWEDVDFEEDCIHIRHNLVYRKIGGRMMYVMHSPKTEAGGREIPMLKEVRAALKQLYKNQEREAFEPVYMDDGSSYNLVFRNRFSGALTPACINHAIKRILRDYNETHPENTLPDFSVHQLRHTFATRLCENSSNIKAIQDIMGHASIRTTMDIYAEATRESRRNTLEELEGKCVIF